MNKQELKLKRLDLLQQIDAQNAKRCQKCHSDSVGVGKTNCNCHAARKVRSFGARLVGLTSELRASKLDKVKQEVKDEGLSLENYRLLRESDMSLKEIKKLTKMTIEEFDDFRRVKPQVSKKSRKTVANGTTAIKRAKDNGLTVEAYKRHREEGLRDREIEIRYGLFERDIYKFKINYNIVDKKGKSKRSKEDLEYIERAEMNGIKKSTYLQRLSKGVSKEEACTIPVVRGSLDLTVERYERFKDLQMTDKEIAKKLNVSNSCLNRFKYKNDLSEKIVRKKKWLTYERQHQQTNRSGGKIKWL